MKQYACQGGIATSDTILQAIELLNPQQASVIYSRFFDGKTLKQTGDEIGTNAERARQVECKALRVLRHPAIKRRIIQEEIT